MTGLLERVITPIYRFFATIRLARIAHKYGYRLSNIVWMPEEPGNERIVRIVPMMPDGDGFKHQGDDCVCGPKRTSETGEDGEYILIMHRWMGQ